MPAAFLVAGAIIRLAPLDWTGPAISLLVLQLLASLALLRALYVILGRRWVLLIPLTFALFTPLAVPGFAWWAAALNSLPMLAALAWVCADAVLLVRTGNQRYAATGVLVYLGGLLFFEKAAVIPFVAFAVAPVDAHQVGIELRLSGENVLPQERREAIGAQFRADVGVRRFGNDLSQDAHVDTETGLETGGCTCPLIPSFEPVASSEQRNTEELLNVSARSSDQNAGQVI